MEAPAPYYLPQRPQQLTEPVATVLRASGFVATELFDANGLVSVQGVWRSADQQLFHALYRHDTRAGEKTLELQATQGFYQASTGRLLVRHAQDVAFLLESWQPLVRARQASP